jgi:hypothetical protein
MPGRGLLGDPRVMIQWWGGGKQANSGPRSTVATGVHASIGFHRAIKNGLPGKVVSSPPSKAI